MNSLCCQPRDGLGSFLSRNNFLTDATHAGASLKVTGLLGYIEQARIRTSSAADATPFVGADAAAGALSSIGAFQALADTGRALIDAARTKLSNSTPPSTPPPAGHTVESWRLSWYIELDAMTALLPQLEEARQSSTGPLDSLMSAAKEAQRRAAVAAGTPPPPPMPKGVPDKPIDWSQAEATLVVPEGLKALGNSAAKSIGSVVGGVTGAATLAPFVLLAVGAVILLNRGGVKMGRAA